jgi:hypothetical protein
MLILYCRCCCSLWLGVAFAVTRFLPYVGMITIVMNDYPWLKYTLILGLGLLVMTSKE